MQDPARPSSSPSGAFMAPGVADVPPNTWPGAPDRGPRDASAAGANVPPAWWATPLDALLDRLGSNEQGLTQARARDLIGRHGPNRLDAGEGPGRWRLLLRQLANPLVLILLGGALVSLVLREWVDAAIILVIVLGSSLLGFAQEWRASQAVAQLRDRLTLTCRVWRDGQLLARPVTELVPGDVVELRAGDLVPADGRVLQARDFLVSQSSLTGESLPVEKTADATPAQAALAERHNAVYLGTSVRSGSARVIVVGTGRDTVYGDIASRLGRQAPETDFQRGVRHFGVMLVQVMVVMVVFVLVANHALGRPVVESLLFAVALAVGLSPELLPAIVAVTLAAGARVMAARGVLVRRLEAIEDLGAITTLCTDKTGTLTLGQMQVGAALDAAGNDSASVKRLAWLNAALETGIGNPIDTALIEMGHQAGWDGQIDTERARKIDEIPYDFTRRRLTVVMALEGGTDHLMITKGAVAEILAVCTRLQHADPTGPIPPTEAPLTDATRAALSARFEALSCDGLRVLALACRRQPARPAGRTAYTVADEAQMSFLGFITFADPPKPQAAQTLQDLAHLAVRTQIITGDNRHVAIHLARSLGLDLGPADARVLSGADMARLSSAALAQRAQRTTLFVEVDPQQKEQIVRALQSRGEVVAYMGDGINDAPALHAADVGISVDQAVDVARESADVVLLRPDLDVLRLGLLEGRRTFANTLKYISITTSANFGNMVSMALATPLLPFLPLAPKQILLNNFLSDLPSIAISTDRVDDEQLRQSQRWDMAEVRRFMIVFGLISSLFDGLTFTVLLAGTPEGERVFQTAWFVVSVLTELAVVWVLRSRRAAWRSRPSTALAASSAAVAMLVLCLPWTGPFAGLFGLTPLRPSLLAILVALVVGYILVTEFAKHWFYRTRPRRQRRQGASSPSR